VNAWRQHFARNDQIAEPGAVLLRFVLFEIHPIKSNVLSTR
jgi:hypothetical protein